MSTSLPTTLTFVVYILGMLLIGFWAYRSTRDFDDYILGGRSLGSFVTALSAGASDMSGWLLMGLPGAIFIAGLSEVWIAFGLLIGAWLNWLFVAGRLRVHTEYSHNALTLPDYFANRFDDRSRLLRILSALVILIFFTVYCASGMVAGARLFESTFELDYPLALGLGALATIIYVFIGGFLAVSWTDTVQASLMILALLLTPLFAFLSLGDTALLQQSIEAVRPEAFDLWAGVSWISILSLMSWGLGYFGQPHILIRFMAVDSLSSIPGARRIGMSWMLLTLFGAVAVGMLGIAWFNIHPEGAAVLADNPERVFLEMTRLLFNPWVAGVILSAVLAAVMSTLSAQLLVSSSALTQDFYKAFLRPGAGPGELIWVGRGMVLLIAAVAIGIASDPDSRVLGLVSYAWAGFGAAFGPVVLLSVCWRRMTRNGALAGMLVGALTVLGWQWLETPLYEIVPGFVLGGLAVILVSLWDRRPGAVVLARFDAADRVLREQRR